MKKDPNIQIVFIDIDCTLLDHSKKPSRFDISSIKYLKKLINKGVKVFLCTARPYHSVEQINMLSLFTPTGMIYSNGGSVFIGEKIIYKTIMDQKEFEDLCALAIKYHVNVEGIREKDCFLISPADDRVTSLFATYPENIPPVEDYHNQEVIGATLFAPKELDEEIRPLLPKDFYYYRYHDNGVDVASIPHIKGDGINIVLDFYKLNKDNALAIGDDTQDIAMFKEVKYGIAMGNAKDEVKKEATYITKSVTSHGVKYILKKLIK